MAVPDDFDVDLEEWLEGGRPAADATLHVESVITQLIDDERDIAPSELSGVMGEELEWRLAEDAGA